MDKNSRASGPGIVITCESVSTSVQVQEFRPLPAFPQPYMNVAVRNSERAKHPDVIMFGDDDAALRIEFPIADSFLDSLQSGADITVRFDKQKQVYPAPPPAMRAEFVGKCRALVPPGMRKG